MVAAARQSCGSYPNTNGSAGANAPIYAERFFLGEGRETIAPSFPFLPPNPHPTLPSPSSSPSLTAKETAVRGRLIDARCAARSRTPSPATAPHKPVQRVTAPRNDPNQPTPSPKIKALNWLKLVVLGHQKGK